MGINHLREGEIIRRRRTNATAERNVTRKILTETPPGELKEKLEDAECLKLTAIGGGDHSCSLTQGPIRNHIKESKRGSVKPSGFQSILALELRGISLRFTVEIGCYGTVSGDVVSRGCLFLSGNTRVP